MCRGTSTQVEVCRFLRGVQRVVEACRRTELHNGREMHAGEEAHREHAESVEK